MKLVSFDKYYRYTHDRSYLFAGHRHGGFEANFVLDGALEVTLGDSVIRLGAGDAAIWWAGIFHRNRVVGDADATFISLHFHAEAADGGGVFQRPAVFSLKQSDLSLIGVLDDELRRDPDTVVGEITPAGCALLEALLLRLASTAKPPEPAMDPATALYRRAVGVMSDAIGERLRVSDIARRCGVCDTLLKNAFANYAGKGVQAYFLDMKMAHARRRLADGARAETVAAELGFSSPAYFSQTFRRENGMPPREFAKKTKQPMR